MKPALFFLFCSLGLARDPATQALLEKTASAYGNIQTYVIDLTWQGESHGAAKDAMPLRQPLNRIVIARSGDAFHYDVRTDRSEKALTWITDGRATWQFRRDLNEYIMQPANPWPKRLGPGDDLPGIEWKFFTKFRALLSVTGEAKLITAKMPLSDDCPGQCAKIEIVSKEGVSEELSIAVATGLVYRSVMKRTRKQGGADVTETVTTTWNYRQTSGRVDPKLFVFMPPKSAQKVGEFRRTP